MLALVPADEYLPDLTVDGGLDPGELHLTLAYLGDDVTSWPPENQQAVLDQAKVLDSLQKAVAVGLAGRNGIPEQHPNFFPHISAIQGTDSVPLTYAGPVVFDRLRVALGDVITDFPLAASDGALRGEHCQHPVVRYGQDWRYGQDCQCIMRGCVLDEASKTLVEARRRSRVLAVDITGQCRANHGDAGAYVEALARLRVEYDAITRGWRGQSTQLVIRLVLEMKRPSPDRPTTLKHC